MKYKFKFKEIDGIQWNGTNTKEVVEYLEQYHHFKYDWYGVDKSTNTLKLVLDDEIYSTIELGTYIIYLKHRGYIVYVHKEEFEEYFEEIG